MSAGENSERSENLHTANADNSSSSDSGFSSSSNRSQKDDLKRGGGGEKREKSQSPSQNQENLKTGSGFFNKFPRGGDRNRESDEDFFQDPFFSERTSKFKKRFANRPKLSERIFGNKKGSSASVFDNDSFVDDLRKRIQEEKKMFFDGGADPFAGAFGAGGRPASPVGGSSGRAGFPFEDLRSGARARFDEFANRHPMFSTMRNQPPWNMDDPFGHHGFPRERNNSGSSGAGSGASTASTGEERVIPIQIIRDDAPKPPARGKSPAPPQTEPIRVAREASPQPQTAGPQRCNTEPTHPIVLEDSRNTRAHSAPPSQNGNDKFVTKVSIDTNGSKPTTTQVGGNCSKSPKPESPANNGGRSIPIIIEGRQAPVFNANVNGNCPGGQSSAKEAPQPKVSRPADCSPTPPPKKQTLPRDPLAQVNAVSEEVKELEKLVDMFQGTSREEREYMLLDEMLTRCLIKLDVVEAEGRDDVRTARKDCIRYIQSCISKLEKKHPLTEKPDEEQTMETAPAEDSQPSAETEKMETGSQQLSSNQNTPPLQLGSSSETANPTSAENSTPEPSNKGEGVQTMEVDSKETQPASASGDQQPVKA